MPIVVPSHNRSVAGRKIDLRPSRTQKNPRHTYFLGVDGGGTKTHAIITDANFQIIAEAFSGASNPLRVGMDTAIRNLEAAIFDALKQAHLELADITAAGFGIAGVSHPIHYHTMKEELTHALGLENLELVTDAKIALTGALDGKPGVIVIAGTGSIAFGLNETGEDARSGGWGPTFSDEGSGYDIARRALKAIASSFDGRASKTQLATLIYKELGIKDAADLPSVIYDENTTPAQIASLARLVSEAAAQGDEVAREILARAGAELGHLAVAVIRRLRMEKLEFRVACIGSVFHAGEFILESFRREILAAAPHAVIGEPLHPPTIGAVKIAEMSIGE